MGRWVLSRHHLPASTSIWERVFGSNSLLHRARGGCILLSTGTNTQVRARPPAHPLARTSPPLALRLVQILRRGEGRALPEDKNRHGALLSLGGPSRLRGCRHRRSGVVRTPRALQCPRNEQPRRSARAVQDIYAGVGLDGMDITLGISPSHHQSHR